MEPLKSLLALAVLLLAAACAEKTPPPAAAAAAAAALKSYQGEDLRVPATKALPPGRPAGAYEAGIVPLDETRGARIGPVSRPLEQPDPTRDKR